MPDFSPSPDFLSSPEILAAPIVRQFETSSDYDQALARDVRFASIHECARRRLPVSEADFLYLQAQVGQDPENLQSPALMLVWNILEDPLHRIRLDFINFYGLEQVEVDLTAVHTLLWGVDHASLFVLTASKSVRLDWGSHLMEIMLQLMWAYFRGSYLPTSRLDDASFRRLFEEMWPELMCYQGVKFDFRVVPKFSPDDFVRYQKLPHGDKDIRAMISTYIVHQATAYPHLLEPVVPDRICGAYRERMKLMYTPLVQKVVKRILAGLTANRAEAKRLKAAVTQQAWEAYEEAVREFRFHVPYSGKPLRWGLLGVLGLAESEQERESFDAFLQSEMAIHLGLVKPGEKVRSTDFTPIVFAHYVNKRLETWWRRAFPPIPREAPAESLDRPVYGDDSGTSLGETISGGSGWQIDANTIVREEPAVFGPDGTPYLTIEQVARQQGASLKQLRYLETIGLYSPKRVRDIPGANHSLGKGSLGKDYRLYPDTSEAREKIAAALARTATRSSALMGQEMPRKVVATLLNIPFSQLRSWERSGKLKPVRRGRSVIYTPECIELARQLMKIS